MRLAQYALGHGAFKPQRVADGKNGFADREILFRGKDDRGDLGVELLDPQHDEIVERGGGDNLHLLVHDAPQHLPFQQELGDGNMLFAGNHMEVGDQISLVVDEKSGAEPRRRLYDHHGRGVELGRLGGGDASGRLHGIESVGVGCRDVSIGRFLLRSDGQHLVARDAQHIEAEIEHHGIAAILE